MTKAQADRELIRLGIVNEGTRDSLLSRALRAGSATARTSAGSICVTCYGGSYDVTGGVTWTGSKPTVTSASRES